MIRLGIELQAPVLMALFHRVKWQNFNLALAWCFSKIYVYCEMKGNSWHKFKMLSYWSFIILFHLMHIF